MRECRLPEGFRFSQQALEDYTACPRRFYLRYLCRLRWPTPPRAMGAHERRMTLGSRFHRLVQRHLLGLPEAVLQREANADEALAALWATYLREAPFADLSGRRYVELRLGATLDGHRLIARYDLIVVGEDGTATIVDWKTNARAEERSLLARRWQTRLYRYLLVRAGAELNGGRPFAPEAITMRYWYAAVPAERRLPYTRDDFARDEADLRTLLAAIAAADGEADFPRVEDERSCRFCPYRTFCEGEVPLVAEAEPEEQEPWESWDFDQIAEIEFH